MTAAHAELERRFVRLYFWMFWLQCINGTFLNLFLKQDLGYTGTKIGILASVYAGAGVLITPWLGLKFDASHRRPRFVARLLTLAAAAFCFYFIQAPVWALLPIPVALAAGWMPAVPLVDALATGSHLGTDGYGRVRRWGSAGFMVAGFVVGLLAERLGRWVMFPAFAACALGAAWLVRSLPTKSADAPRPHDGFAGVARLLAITRYRRFLLVTLISFAGGSASWMFRSIRLSELGFSDHQIGLLWFLMIPGEILCFSLAPRLIRTLGEGGLMLAGLGLGGTRYLLLSCVHAAGPAAVAIEMLHGFAFALQHTGSVSLIRQAVPDRLRGTAQVLYMTTAMGIGGALASPLAGRAYDLYGAPFVMRVGGALTILAGILQFFTTRATAERNAA